MEHHIMHVFNEDVNKRTKKMCNGKVSDSSSMTTYINILSLHQYDSLIWDIQHAHSPFIIMLFKTINLPMESNYHDHTTKKCFPEDCSINWIKRIHGGTKKLVLNCCGWLSHGRII